jgi:GTP cyclohydrolase I
VQEKLTQQIFNFWKDELKTEDIIVRISAEHFCMKLRGIEDPCSNTITCVSG